MVDVAFDGDLRGNALTYASMPAGVRGSTRGVLTLLWLKQHGYPDFDVSWVEFLIAPELTEFGTAVRRSARQDPVIYGLWRDIVFGRVGLAASAVGARQLYAFIVSLKAGRAVPFWPQSGRQAAELLIYLYLHPVCRVGVPPVDWQGPYADLHRQYGEVTKPPPGTLGAAKHIHHYMRAAVPWGVGGGAVTRCREAVSEAARLGLVRIESKLVGATWIDPRYDSDAGIEAHRKRWIEEADAASAGRASRRAAAALTAAERLDSLQVAAAEAAATRSVGQPDASSDLSNDGPDSDHSSSVGTVPHEVIREVEALMKKLVAAFLTRRGRTNAEIGKLLGAPPKAVAAWARQCETSDSLRRIVDRMLR